MDVNSGDFPEGPYDLVVNSAAAHHIAYIDRVFVRCASSCPKTAGSLPSTMWDLTGTSTRPDAWEEAWRVNGSSPITSAKRWSIRTYPPCCTTTH